jgi:invasion protein IalB
MMTTSSIKCAIVPALIVMHLLAWFNATKAADDPRAMELKFEPWSKSCLGQSLCFVGKGARGACVPSGGAVAIHTLNGKATSLIINFGTRRALDGAISIRIDQGQPILVSHPRCYPTGCRGELEINDDFVELLRRSQTITIEATDTAHRNLRLSFSLAGFAQAFDGPGIESNVFEETQEQLKEELRKRAEQSPPPPPCDD